MNTKEAIRAAMETSLMVFKGYLGDLEDADLMERPERQEVIPNDLGALKTLIRDRTSSRGAAA